jgi:hypothetical protein
LTSGPKISAAQQSRTRADSTGAILNRFVMETLSLKEITKVNLATMYHSLRCCPA